MGFGTEGEPFSDRTIRGWRTGPRTPDADIVLALANRFQVSLDHYVFGGAIDEEIEKLQERRRALGATA